MKHLRYNSLLQWPTYTPEFLWNTLLYMTSERYYKEYGVRVHYKEFG